MITAKANIFHQIYHLTENGYVYEYGYDVPAAPWVREQVKRATPPPYMARVQAGLQQVLGTRDISDGTTTVTLTPRLTSFRLMNVSGTPTVQAHIAWVNSDGVPLDGQALNVALAGADLQDHLTHLSQLKSQIQVKIA